MKKKKIQNQTNYLTYEQYIIILNTIFYVKLYTDNINVHPYVKMIGIFYDNICGSTFKISAQ